MVSVANGACRTYPHTHPGPTWPTRPTAPTPPNPPDPPDPPEQPLIFDAEAGGAALGALLAPSESGVAVLTYGNGVPKALEARGVA